MHEKQATWGPDDECETVSEWRTVRSAGEHLPKPRTGKMPDRGGLVLEAERYKYQDEGKASYDLTLTAIYYIIKLALLSKGAVQYRQLCPCLGCLP